MEHRKSSERGTKTINTNAKETVQEKLHVTIRTQNIQCRDTTRNKQNTYETVREIPHVTNRTQNKQCVRNQTLQIEHRHKYARDNIRYK